MKLLIKLLMFALVFVAVCYIESNNNAKNAIAATIPDKVVIMNKRTGVQMHMDANYKVGSWNSSTNQWNQWMFKPIGNHYNIVNVGSNLQLHMDKDNKLVGYNDSQSLSNLWDITSVSDNYYVITNVRTGLQLHMNDNFDIVAWNDAQNSSNQWKLDDDFNKYASSDNSFRPVPVKQQIDSHIIDYARTLIGTPYVWGGTTPSGFDCSGFTQYVYNHFGFSIGRTTHDQVNSGIAVSRENLKAGDLVLTDPGHVGMYVGDNQMIHAPYPGAKIRIETIWRFYAGRRIVN